eukprot:6587825-Pyramimonas_sp.AAC.1
MKVQGVARLIAFEPGDRLQHEGQGIVVRAAGPRGEALRAGVPLHGAQAHGGQAGQDLQVWRIGLSAPRGQSGRSADGDAREGQGCQRSGACRSGGQQEQDATVRGAARQGLEDGPLFRGEYLAAGSLGEG